MACDKTGLMETSALAARREVTFLPPLALRGRSAGSGMRRPFCLGAMGARRRKRAGAFPTLRVALVGGFRLRLSPEERRRISDFAQKGCCVARFASEDARCGALPDLPGDGFPAVPAGPEVSRFSPFFARVGIPLTTGN